MIFHCKRRTKLRNRRRFIWGKVWIVLYTIAWCSAVYGTYELLDISLLAKILFTVVLVVFAPTLGDLTESYEEYKEDTSRSVDREDTG